MRSRRLIRAPVFDRSTPVRDPSAAWAWRQGLSWYLADLAVASENPWDLAHLEVPAQLGIDASAVLFAEPDILHTVYPDPGETDTGGPFAAAAQCVTNPQDSGGGKATGPDRFGWHLEDNFTQLRSARGQVNFSEPRTRIAHVDTGYYRAHETVPEHIAHQLERSFVDDGHDPNSAADPDNQVLAVG